jgi:hypothetical protein
MKPKIILCLTLVLSGGRPGGSDVAQCADASSAVKIKIDIPELSRDDRSAFPRFLENRNPSRDHFFVVIENTSSKPIFIPNLPEMYRWLHFEITTADGKTIIVNPIPHEYAKYVRYDLRLGPGEVAVREIYYCDGRDWEKFPFPDDAQRANTARKVTLRAVFERSVSTNSQFLGCWTGKAVSEPYEVLLKDHF